MKYKASLLAAIAMCGGAFVQTSFAAEPNVPRIAIKAEAPLQLPTGWNFGEVPGVAVTSKGHVIVFSRSDKSGAAFASKAAQLLEFDQNGKFVREIAKNHFAFSFAEAVRVDKNDNIWVVDKGSNMVVKFSQEGREDVHYSRREEPQEWRPFAPRDVNKETKANVTNPTFFGQPTDIAWDSKGDSFVTDGYLNSRVSKWEGNGGWDGVMKVWGQRGTGPGQFYIPHGVVIDSKDNVYVADRGNGRVQVFDTEGKFLRQFTLMGQVPSYSIDPLVGNLNPVFMPNEPKLPRGIDPTKMRGMPEVAPEDESVVPGAPTAMCITPGANQVLYIADLAPSRIYKVSLEGKVLGVFGNPGGKLGEFRAPHALACQDEKTIWVADMLNWRVQKITMQ